MNDKSTARAKHYGKYPAVVIDDAAGEGAHRGKVKVRVPAILEEDDGGRPRPIEVIARPCLPPGCFFVPAVGDRLWIEFAQGDVDTPIWVGVWYPDDAAPETADDEAPTEKQRVIRSPGGHVLTLDDDAGTVAIKDKHGNKVVLEQGKITIQQDQASVVLDNGKVTVTANAGITLSGGQGQEAGLLKFSADVLMFLMTHQHTGNLGAPTGPPTPPGRQDWFTTTTKAE